MNLVVTDGRAGADKAELQRIEYEQRQRLQKYVSHKAYDGRSSTEFYKFGKVLGQGSFGKVRLAWHKLTGARVAVKSYEKERLKEPSHWRRTQQEIRCARVCACACVCVWRSNGCAVNGADGCVCALWRSNDCAVNGADG